MTSYAHCQKRCNLPISAAQATRFFEHEEGTPGASWEACGWLLGVPGLEMEVEPLIGLRAATEEPS